jgi:flagellar protein FlaG
MSGSKSPNLISDIFPEPNPEGRIFTSPEKGEEIEFLNRAAGFFQNKLEFRYDEATGRIVARVIDRDSGEEVKQIPSQEALDAVFRLEKLKGVLFDETD